MSERDKTEAFVTLATNDTYSIGCLVLGAALRRVQTTRRLVVMITEGVSNPMRAQLAQLFDVLQEVNLLDSHDPVNLALLGRPDLNVTFTKLHCWRLTQFTKAVFLDADTLVLQNVDELFDREELSAAPDAGWPDCFNSGVFVFRPSQETYDSLLSFATSQGSFDGGDQGLLNMYFKNWSTEDISKHLPFIYNVVSQAFYSYLPAFTQFKDRVKIVHFIGAVKPWHHTFDPVTGRVTPLPGTGHSQEFLEVWWSIFMEKIQPSLDPSLAVLVGNPARLSGGEGAGASKEPVPDAVRKLNWEKGQIDYLGQDSFENIQRKIEETLTSESKPTPTPFAPAPEEKSAPKPVETTKVTTGVGKISITTSSKKK
ncbi:glycogenin-1-like isoform X2 [Dreissena polymorpha]|uniref:glycogenin-1-like isoform X2 n=1 Tax=Dreissena polymorpha TaxID=45954 RepID=UPI002263BC6E|nr:glycogenin-1-like isoform X2 [Dreissena polymorpha]